MYQGKFDKKRKSTTVNTHDLVASRNEAASRQQAQQSAPRKQAAPAAREMPVKKQAPIAREMPAKKQAAPRKQQPAPVVQTVPERKGPRLGSVIFYTLYFLFIFLFFVGTFIGLQWLHGWLSDYEAAQPTVKCEEVFTELFSDPDWGALYDASGIQDTEYEGKETFVAYMENRVGEGDLVYQETSAGLSGDKKYFVKLGDDKIAYFTLIAEGKTDNVTDIPNWKLGEVSLFFEREKSFLIQKQDGQTAYVNGVPLSDDFTIQINTTKADSSKFLPSGAPTDRVLIQQITDLMGTPTVTVKDAKGNDVAVTYDEEKKMFVAEMETVTISDTEKELALNALKAYAQYQIKEASTDTLAKYFDSTGEAYSSIMKTVLTWTKGNNGYSFANDSVSNYIRHSDTMFSVYATTELSIKLTDGGATEKPINATLLFSQVNGKWKVTRMTNADVSVPVSQVRLTFMNNDAVLSSEFYDNDIESLATPLVSVPEGKVFSGWVKETVSESGSKALTLMFEPDENGDVSIPSGTVLEPMTLFPLFEDASAAATTEGA